MTRENALWALTGATTAAVAMAIGVSAFVGLLAIAAFPAALCWGWIDSKRDLDLKRLARRQALLDEYESVNLRTPPGWVRDETGRWRWERDV